MKTQSNVQESEANTRLIATAPELLNKLIELVDDLKDNYILGDDPLYSSLEEAEEIIKRATE